MAKGSITTLIAIVLVLIAGYWIFNTPGGMALRNNMRANSQAAVYRANDNNSNFFGYRSNNTLVPVDSYDRSYGPKTYPQATGQVAYVTYPIAKSSNSSSSSNYYPSSTSSSSSSYSSYYIAPTPGYNYYPSNPAPQPQGGCYVSGCSNQICSDQQGMISTCEYREEYACYQGARCERQSNGQCGWTMTDQLYSCLSGR